MSGPRTQWWATGANAALVTLLVVVGVGLGVTLIDRWAVQIDLSEDRASSLQPETLTVLDRLVAEDVEVRITAFTVQRKGGDDWYRNRVLGDLMSALDGASSQVSAQLVDFDLDRVTAEDLGVKRYGTVVVEGRGDRVDLTQRELFEQIGPRDQVLPVFHGEALVRRTIQQILSDEARTLYVLEGHGERRLDDRSGRGLVKLGQLLEGLGWRVRGLDLLAAQTDAPRVPDDASAVLLVGPTAPLTPDEDEAIASYLGGGGRLVAFMDPSSLVPHVLEEVGVFVPAGEVRDQASWLPHEDRPLLRYRRHPLTEQLVEADIDTVVASAAPLSTAERPGTRVEVLLETSRAGWIERGDEQPAVFDSASDVLGPVAVAVALRLAPPHPLMSQDSTARVVVVGDTDGFSDELIAAGPGNAAFVEAIIRWVVGAEDSGVVTGRRGGVRQVALSAQQLSSVRLIVLGFLPLGTLAFGLGVWARRRDT